MPHVIAVCNDFLRDRANQLDNCRANRSWLAAMIAHLAGPGFEVREMGDDRPGPRRLDTAEFMAALDIPPGPAGWAAAWDAAPTDRFVGLLAERLAAPDLVVGFGLPNVVVTALDGLGIKFIDFELSPLRFAKNLELDARTNLPAVTASPAWQPPLDPFVTAAADMIGFVSRSCPDSIPAGAGAVGVIFGQTELDAALVHEGVVTDFGRFAPTLRDWAEGLDHVLFRPHPYAGGSGAFALLRGILPTVRPTLMNSYHLLASQRLRRVLALSSGIVDEAAFFRVPAVRLFMPKRRSSGLPYSMVADLNLVRGDVLEALIAGAAPPPVGRGGFDLRKQFQSAWGLAEKPAPSDFRNPPMLALYGRAGRPSPRGVARAWVAVTRRETRRLATQATTLHRRLRSLAPRLAGWNDRVTRQPVPQAPASGGDKDFSYTSGERQTAREYGQIRRDHRARYELAHEILPPDIAVLDLFCGNGYGSYLLSQKRAVLGIDGSEPAITVAARCFTRFGARFDARCYPFEDGRDYDAIVSYESIEHVPDGEAFFRFLVGHLRPGGWILYSTPNEDLLPFDPKVHIHHHRHYTHRDTLAFAHANGLQVEAWFGQDVYRLGRPAGVAVLDEGAMDLRPRTAGQFTCVVARKPARAA